MRRALALSVAFAALAYSRGAASAISADISDTARGGLAVDGWGDNGTETAFVSGTLHLRIPAGAKVKKAILYSSVASATGTVPVGPTVGVEVLHRQVELGTPAVATLVLEGVPNRDATFANYALFSMDVTSQIRPLIETAAGAAPGGEVLIPIRERGDDPTLSFTYPKIPGHTLVVEYTHAAAPLRRIAVYAGAISQSGTDATLSFPGPLGLACKTPGAPGYEGVTLSIMMPWEISCIDYNTLRIDGAVFATHVSGDDDGTNGRTCPRKTGGVFSNVDLRSLITVGSFGGLDPAAGVASGTGVGVKGDVVLGAPPTTGEDDELYDLGPVLANGATSFGLRYGGTADDEKISVVAMQGPALLATGDADNDGVPDAVEGGCVDSDGDGIPDYLDSDSDNDCSPDGVDADRTTPSTNPNSNCAGATPVCQRATGTCVGDGDDDGDGIPNLVENALGTNPNNRDSDGDGIPDNVETSPNGSATGPFTRVDSDGDGIIDALDSDSDNDGLPDSVEAGPTPSMPRDSDGNGVPDYRQNNNTSSGGSSSAGSSGSAGASGSAGSAGDLDASAGDASSGNAGASASGGIALANSSGAGIEGGGLSCMTRATSGGERADVAAVVAALALAIGGRLRRRRRT